MKYYYEASKLIKPKLEALTVAEAQLHEAEGNLAVAMQRLNACNEHLAGLKEQFEAQQRASQQNAESGESDQNKPDSGIWTPN